MTTNTVPTLLHCLRRSIVRLVLAIYCGSILGCHDANIGFVDGVVTLDDAPVPEATVMFQPENGRTSVGETDASGHYALIFSQDERGAVVGTHRVTVETYRIRLDEAGNPVETVETLPAKFNRESELQRDVVPGQQLINLDLKSR